MAYKIVIQQVAILDAMEYAARIKERSGPGPADKWLRGLKVLISSLSEMPGRFKLIEERDQFEVVLRQVSYHSHRVIYHVDEGELIVHVLRIYHGSRKAFTEEDIFP